MLILCTQAIIERNRLVASMETLGVNGPSREESLTTILTAHAKKCIHCVVSKLEAPSINSTLSDLPTVHLSHRYAELHEAGYIQASHYQKLTMNAMMALCCKDKKPSSEMDHLMDELLTRESLK